MILHDQEMVKTLKRVNILELQEMIDEYPEEERAGRSDWEVLANEAGYLLSLYHEYDTVHYDDLRESRAILNKVRKRKMSADDLTKTLWRTITVQSARESVNEYNRLKRLVERLKKMGLECPYC